MPEPISTLKPFEEEDRGTAPCQCEADRPPGAQPGPDTCQCHLKASWPGEATRTEGRQFPGTGRPFDSRPPHPEKIGPGAAQPPGLFRTILGTIIAVLLMGTGLLFILFGLVPVVVLAVALFLPVLVPLMLIGLGILFTEDLKDKPADVRQEWRQVPDLVHPKG